MGTITLDDRDTAILQRLSRDDAAVEGLADDVDCDRAYLEDRLPELADNGLVRPVREDAYAITESGRRSVDAPGDGTADEGIDTPEAVEQHIESFDLRPDREEAVRNAFGFLQYWGAATGGEIVDGVYSENPAGFETSEAWWDECVCDRLADLPPVDPPERDESEWTYADTPIVDRPCDGRDVADDEVTEPSARFALERADLDAAERNAVRAAFDLLVREGDANADELQRRVYPDHDAGYDSPEAWWEDCVGATFASVPGVEQTNPDRDLWEYRQSVADVGGG